MRKLPEIFIKIPFGINIQTDLDTLTGLPKLTVDGPSMQYHDLYAKTDTNDKFLLAQWSDPYQPHKYVIYQEHLLNAKFLELEIKVYPKGVYPQSIPNPNITVINSDTKSYDTKSNSV
jgi:hypothetical protein